MPFSQRCIAGHFRHTTQRYGTARIQEWWTKFVSKPVERSTYVLFSSLCLIALFHFWQPIGITIWNIEHPIGRNILYSLLPLAGCSCLATTFLINHFDLFGLRQVYLYLRGKEYTHLKS
jgi:protein-S-isoprenylcysteine O-methyltransferase Ste14